MTTAKETTIRIAAEAAAARRTATGPTFEIYAPDGVTAPAITWPDILAVEWEILADDSDIDDSDIDYDYRLFRLTPRRRPTLFDYVDPTGQFDGILTIEFIDGNLAWPNGWQNNGGIAYAKYETATRVEYHWEWPDGVIG